MSKPLKPAKPAKSVKSAKTVKHRKKRNYRLSVATASHRGDSSYQQDRVEVLQHPYVKNCLMVIVADGMGGRSGGALASGQVVDSARELLAQFDVVKDDPSAMLRQLVIDAHAVIRMLNLSSELEPHSTLAAHLVMPSGANYWVHSGDSRVYHFRKGRMRARTRDHSHVQMLIDSGKITERQAINHPQSNLLTGCLGMDAESPPFELFTIKKLAVGDVVLCCTDGLWAYFSEMEMAKIVEALTPAEACQQLLIGARERAAGHGDNIAVAIMKVTRQSSYLPQGQTMAIDWSSIS